jgi:hypothetical protein
MSANEPVGDWAAFGERLSRVVDFGLLTVLEVDWTRRLVVRSFSSDEAHYPSGGSKDLMDGTWARQVIFEGRAFMSVTEEDFRAAFADHALLHALGLAFALNVPMQRDGKTVRTVNLLRGRAPFPEAALAATLAVLRETWPASVDCP